MTEKKKHILLLYRQMIPSIRLCGHVQMEALAQKGVVEYRAVQTARIKKEDMDWAEVVLLGRLDNRYEYQIARLLHNAGKKLIYVIDDDLLNIPHEISSAMYYGRNEIQHCIRETIRISDAILSPSPILLKKYTIDGQKAIQIEEPAIDPVPYEERALNKIVKIGFAGSIDRAGDVESILRDALIRIKSYYGKRVQFEFFGAIPSFANELEAKCFSYCESYQDYREKLNALEWDIGLAPMPDTQFHACKHYNKFVEYAAAGVVGVFSSVQPYIRLEQRGAPGVYVSNDVEAWYKAICKLIDEPELRERERKNCVDYAEKYLNVAYVAEQLQKKVLDIEQADTKKIRLWELNYTRLNGIVYTMIEVWKRYGIHTPLVVLQKAMHKGK